MQVLLRFWWVRKDRVAKATRPKRNPRRRRLHVARSRRAARRARVAPRGSAQSCRETIPTAQSYSHLSTRSKKSTEDGRAQPCVSAVGSDEVRLLFLGGTGPVGMSASRIALARGHEVVVAHSGKHEPGDVSVRHLHGERDALLAPGGPAARASTDVIVDTRTTEENVAALLRCAREAGTQRLVIVSSTDVYEYFVSGSGDERA